MRRGARRTEGAPRFDPRTPPHAPRGGQKREGGIRKGCALQTVCISLSARPAPPSVVAVYLLHSIVRPLTARFPGCIFSHRPITVHPPPSQSGPTGGGAAKTAMPRWRATPTGQRRGPVAVAAAGQPVDEGQTPSGQDGGLTVPPRPGVSTSPAQRCSRGAHLFKMERFGEPSGGQAAEPWLPSTPPQRGWRFN